MAGSVAAARSGAPGPAGVNRFLKWFLTMADLLSETAIRLRAQVPEVLRRWEGQVLAEVPAASTVDTEELRDHLHVLLEQVVIALSPDVPEGARHSLTTSER